MRYYSFRKPRDVVSERLQVTKLFGSAFSKQPVQSEGELLQKLSRFPSCKNKKQGKQILAFGVSLNVLKPVKRNKSLFYERNESNERNGFY